MKPIIPFALLGALLAIGANAATTDPVGYITHNINGTGGSGVALTVIAPSLVQPTVFAGSGTPDAGLTKVLNFADGVPTNLDQSYVLEISGTGWWSTVISSTATSITLNDDLPEALAAGTPITVRKHNTVQSLFGENEPGLVPFNGESGDEIQFLTPAGLIVPIVYVPAAISETPTDDWYDLGASEIANDKVIEPGTAVLVQTSSTSPLTFTSAGAVKLTPTEVDVFSGLTLVGHFDAVGATLADLNLSTQMIPLEDPEVLPFDEIQFLTPAGSVDGNVALGASVGGPAMGNLGTSESADGTVFPEGAGAIFKRDASQPAGTLVFPGSTVAP